jgi:riboflavin synthase alpha subunit
VTTLATKGAGARVNLEVDMMAKYAERLLTWRDD